MVRTENEHIEFKRSTAELKEGIISMVAILNKHGQGELFFGIKNDGMPAHSLVSFILYCYSFTGYIVHR